MPGGRPAGPLDPARRPGPTVLDGTMPRAVAPIPGFPPPVGSMDLTDRLLEAAKRAGPKLAPDAREQFMQLFTPMNIGITAFVLAAWAGSHAVGIGEGIDLVLLVVGAFTIGWQVGDVAKDLGSYLKIAANARGDADLDLAAGHLARAVTALGVTVFIALVMKFGAKAGGRIGATVARRTQFGRTIEEWLVAMAKPKEPPLIRRRLAEFLGRIDELNRARPAGGRRWGQGDVEGFLRGTDLSKAVDATRTLGPGEEIVTYVKGGLDASGKPIHYFGDFYTKPGTPINRVGIDDGALVTRRDFVRLKVLKPVETIESRAAGIADTWTTRGTRTLVKPDGTAVQGPAKVLVSGGGVQYIIPDMQSLIDRGYVQVVHEKF